MPRKTRVKRKTAETDVTVELNLDGKGSGEVTTGIPFFDHMLSLFTKHGLFDLRIKAKGDIDVDFHHTVEDVGLCLGEALKKAMGNKKGIKRFGNASVPMMDSLATIVLDMSGRPNLSLNLTEKSAGLDFLPETKRKKTGFDMGLAREFLTALSNTAGIDLHVTLPYGRNLHHAIEAVFKALGRALKEAVSTDRRIKGVLSTKGRL